jgi:hypothetical protein
LNIGDMRYRWHKTVTLPCNWKTALDAFIESYHVPGTHPQLIRPLEHSTRPAPLPELLEDPSYAPAQFIGKNVARFLIEARDPAHPRYATKKALLAIHEYHAQELRALHTLRDLQIARELSESSVPDGPELYAAFGRLRREQSLAAGLNWPEIDPTIWPTPEGNYTVFPNMIFLVNQGALLGYRSCPNGKDPDSCIFDAYAMELCAPDDAPQITFEIYNDWRNGDVGEILSQDFENVEDVTVGLHSSAFSGARLSRIQEIPVFHRHMVLDDYIFGPRPPSPEG